MFFLPICWRSASAFTVHIIVSDSCLLSILQLIDNSLHLLHGHVFFNIVLVSTLYATEKLQTFQLPSSKVKVKSRRPTCVAPTNWYNLIVFFFFLFLVLFLSSICCIVEHRLYTLSSYSITYRRNMRRKHATDCMCTISHYGVNFSSHWNYCRSSVCPVVVTWSPSWMKYVYRMARAHRHDDNCIHSIVHWVEH